MYKCDNGHFFIRVDYRLPSTGYVTWLPLN